MKLTNELEELKYKLGILQEVDCSDSETEKYRSLLKQGMPLPNGVRRSAPDAYDESDENAMFCKTEETKLSKEELAEYLQYKQLSTLLTIKKCVVFFTALTIISLASSAIAALAIFCS